MLKEKKTVESSRIIASYLINIFNHNTFIERNRNFGIFIDTACVVGLGKVRRIIVDVVNSQRKTRGRARYVCFFRSLFICLSNR